MTLPSWLTDALNSANKLHLASDATKILALLLAGGIAIFGHDWQSAAEVAIAGLGTSALVSQAARKASN